MAAALRLPVSPLFHDLVSGRTKQQDGLCRVRGLVAAWGHVHVRAQLTGHRLSRRALGGVVLRFAPFLARVRH